MFKVKALFSVALVAAVSACASGPKLSEVESTITPLAADQGRIYFYRTQLVGAAVQPSIFLNQKKVGTCEPDGVFFVDVAPGKYEANVETEVERKLSLVMEAGEVKYVRCYVSIGILVGRGNLELSDPVEAKVDIADLSYTGGAESGS